jgi:triphosphatase
MDAERLITTLGICFPRMNAVMETKLRLLLDPTDSDNFCRHALLREHTITKPLKQQLSSTYFDTSDFYLKRHDIELRIHRVNREFIQTAKGNAHVMTGLHRRQEWECYVSGPHPDPDAFKNEKGYGKGWSKPLTIAGLADRLNPAFTTEFQRTIWLLRLEHGSEVELALDQGEIRHDDFVAPISEIELELKSGDVGELFDFALQMQRTIPLRIGNISKSECGYALYAVRAPGIAKTSRLDLTPTSSVEHGFRSIIVNCLEQIQGNETGVIYGNDPESVHQMRVGLRRLLCVLGLFSRVVPCPLMLHDELRWLASELGAARDWEVLAGDTLREIITAHSDQPELLALQKTCMQRARSKRRRAAASINSARYAHLMLSFGNWAHGSGWRMQSDSPMRKKLAKPLTEFAMHALWQRHKKLQKTCRLLRDAGTNCDAPQIRHQIRMAAKKLAIPSNFLRRSRQPSRCGRI